MEDTPQPTPPYEPVPEAGPSPTLAPSSAIEAPPVPAASLVPAPVVYTDRRTGLTIFGIIQIILGLLAALMIPFALFGAFMSRMVQGGVTMRPGQVFAGILTYAFVAATLISLGIGSVQAKRWARALTLVTSWYGLIVGTLTTIFMTAALPVMMRTFMAQAQRNTPSPSAGLSTVVTAIIVTLVIIFVAFFLIVVPLGFVIFYGRKDVELTCRDRDPVERWTDRTPLPVLGASVFLTIGALFSLSTGLTTPLFPFFGRYLTGIAGAVCFISLGALDTYLAIALFRLRKSGWWIAVVAGFVRLLSMAITYGRTDIAVAYARIGLSETELQTLNSMPMFRGNMILWWGLLSALIFLGYLLWLKRYFKRPIEPENPPLFAQVI